MLLETKMAARGNAGDQGKTTDFPKLPITESEVNVRIQAALAKYPRLFWLVADVLNARRCR